MHPILFEISLPGMLRLTIPAYGTMLIAGFIVAILLAAHRAGGLGLKSLEVIELGYVTLIGGVIGARLLHVVLNLEQYVTATGGLDSAAGIGNMLWNVVAFWKGGLAFYGGLFGGIAALLLYARYKRILSLDLLDFAAPLTAIGLAVTRIGCFLNGCCFGKPTHVPWAVQFPSYSYAHLHQWRQGLIDFGNRPLPVHPTQLYEMVAAFAIFAFLWMRYPHRKFAGEIFFSFGLLYSSWRFISEFWRADSPMWGQQFGRWVLNIIPLNINQVLSILLFLMFTPLMAWALRQRKLLQD